MMLMSSVLCNGAEGGAGNVTWLSFGSFKGHLEANEKSVDGDEAIGEYKVGYVGNLCMSPTGLSTGQEIIGLWAGFRLKSDIVK